MIKIIKILFFLNIFNINSKYKKCCNKYSNKKNDYNNQNKDDEKDNKDKKNKNFNEKIKYSDFNKDFKFTFIKNSLFQHNNNCTLNAVFSSLFNFPQIQNLLIYNDFDNKLLILSKNLLQKAIKENNKNKAIDYLDIYNNIFEYLKEIIPNYIGQGKLPDTIKTVEFIKLFNNYEILIFFQSKLISFVDYELTKQYFISKDNLVKIINNRSNNPDFKDILKNNNIAKKIYKELKYYDKICEIIDKLDFNRNNTGAYENGNIIDWEYDINNPINFISDNDENLFITEKNIIIIPENENVKEYIKNIIKNQTKNEKDEYLYNFYHFNYIYDKILEDNKIELELISINFIDPEYHIFTINKNVNDNKWYIFDDLYNENCVEANFEQLLKNGFFIEKSGHKYKPEFFYFNAKLKK